MLVEDASQGCLVWHEGTTHHPNLTEGIPIGLYQRKNLLADQRQFIVETGGIPHFNRYIYFLRIGSRVTGCHTRPFAWTSGNRIEVSL